MFEKACSCSVPDGTGVVCLARPSQRRGMSISSGVRSRLTACCAFMGRVLLAASEELEAPALVDRQARVAFITRTLVRLEALLGEIGRVRQQGFCIIDEELEIGLYPSRCRSGTMPGASSRPST